LVPAGADEVSAVIATQFATHGEVYQAVSAQARAMHEMFVSILAASAGSCADTGNTGVVAEG
ncbi:MAG: PE family protein, partial [Mycobacterium sp.]